MTVIYFLFYKSDYFILNCAHVFRVCRMPSSQVSGSNIVSDDFHVLMELLTLVKVPACCYDYTLSTR